MKFLANSSAPARLQRRDGVAALAHASGRALWLVGADLSVFTRLELHTVPARHRARAIAARVRQLAPFADPAWHAADLDGEVLLWSWDAAPVRAAIAAQPGTTRNWEVLPEQVMFAPAADACLRRLGEQALLERWRNGRLLFSALLPADPRERALRLRSAGLASDAEPPTAHTTPAARRWDRPPFQWRRALRDPMVAAGGALALAVLWLLWSMTELAGVRLANERLATRLAAQEESLAPLLAEREQALALAARNAALEEQLARADAIEAAAEFESLAGARYQRVLQWEFNGRGLRVMLEDATPDNRAYVEALTKSPWFPRVSVTPGMRPEQITLDIGYNAPLGSTPLYPRGGTEGGR